MEAEVPTKPAFAFNSETNPRARKKCIATLHKNKSRFTENRLRQVDEFIPKFKYLRLIVFRTTKNTVSKQRQAMYHT